jgi:hypothetical protein
MNQPHNPTQQEKVLAEIRRLAALIGVKVRIKQPKPKP